MKGDCVYRMYDKNKQLLYVGKTDNFRNRVNAHKRGSKWFNDVKHVTLDFDFIDREAVTEAEQAAIFNEQPRYNKQSKSSPYPFSIEKHIKTKDEIKNITLKKKGEYQ